MTKIENIPVEYSSNEISSLFHSGNRQDSDLFNKIFSDNFQRAENSQKNNVQSDQQDNFSDTAVNSKEPGENKEPIVKSESDRDRNELKIDDNSNNSDDPATSDTKSEQINESKDNESSQDLETDSDAKKSNESNDDQSQESEDENAALLQQLNNDQETQVLQSQIAAAANATQKENSSNKAQVEMTHNQLSNGSSGLVENKSQATDQKSGNEKQSQQSLNELVGLKVKSNDDAKALKEQDVDVPVPVDNKLLKSEKDGQKQAIVGQKNEKILLQSEQNQQSSNQQYQQNHSSNNQPDLSSLQLDEKPVEVKMNVLSVKEDVSQIKTSVETSQLENVKPVALDRAIDIKTGSQVQRQETNNQVLDKANVQTIVKAARVAQNQGSSRMQIRLDPPELGHLRIDIKQSNAGLQIQLQATTAKAHQMLEQGANQLKTVLETNGFNTIQVDIQLRMDLKNDQSPDQSFMSDQTEQQELSDQGQSESQETNDEDLEIAYPEDMAESELDDSTLESMATSSSADSNWREMSFTNLDVKV